MLAAPTEERRFEKGKDLKSKARGLKMDDTRSDYLRFVALKWKLQSVCLYVGRLTTAGC